MYYQENDFDEKYEKKLIEQEKYWKTKIGQLVKYNSYTGDLKSGYELLDVKLTYDGGMSVLVKLKSPSGKTFITSLIDIIE